MPSRIKELKNLFANKHTYETKVSQKVILFEISETDLFAADFRKEEWDATDEKVNYKRKVILYYVLSTLAQDVENMFSETTTHFEDRLDSPNNKVDKRWFFVDYISEIEEITKDIYALLNEFLPDSKSFERIITWFANYDNQFKQKIKDKSPKFPQHKTAFFDEMMDFKQIYNDFIEDSNLRGFINHERNNSHKIKAMIKKVSYF